MHSKIPQMSRVTGQQGEAGTMSPIFYEMVKAVMLERELEARAHRSYQRRPAAGWRAAARTLTSRGRRGQ